MATRERVIFNLDRFEWTGPGWLQVWGGWDGMDRRDLADPTLIVHARGGSHRLAPPPDGIRGGIRNWHAIFPWEDDPAAIESAELEFGSNLSVELPAPGSGTGRRRFGRTRLAVRELEPQGERASSGSRAARTGPPAEADPITVHVAVVQAREEAAEAREELKVARAAASRATEDAEGERARRQIEASRFREALDGLRKLAEEELQKERAVSQRLSTELNDFERAISEERTLVAGLRGQLQSLSGELIESQEIAEASRAEADGLRVRVGEVEREAQSELQSLRADLVESRQVAESWGAEAERLRAHAADAQREVETAVGQADQLRTHLAHAEREAHQASGEVERLRAQLEEAAERVELSAAEGENLRAQLETVQRQAEQATAEADRLRTHLERTQQQALQSDADAERLRAQLEAVASRAEEADRLRAELEEAQRATLAAHAESERIRRSLAAVREALQQT